MTIDQINQAGEYEYNRNSVSYKLRRFNLLNHALLKSTTSQLSEQELKARFLELQSAVAAQNIGDKDLERYIQKCLLVNSIKAKNIDLDAFESFINDPFFDKLHGCFNNEVNVIVAAKGFNPINYSWNVFDWYVGSFDDRSLLVKGKELVCVSEQNVQRFAKYFYESDLRSSLVKYQTLRGGPIEAYQTHFGSGAANTLLNSKELLILDDND